MGLKFGYPTTPVTIGCVTHPTMGSVKRRERDRETYGYIDKWTRRR